MRTRRMTDRQPGVTGNYANVIGVFLHFAQDRKGFFCVASRHPGRAFTYISNGRLSSGDTFAEAIDRTDEASQGHPAYYRINCAHPTHFESMLQSDAAWLQRVRGLRANASRRSHAELDASPELDDGDPEELGGQYRALRPLLPRLAVVGGCCGTDHRHVASICAALAA